MCHVYNGKWGKRNNGNQERIRTFGEKENYTLEANTITQAEMKEKIENSTSEISSKE